MRRSVDQLALFFFPALEAEHYYSNQAIATKALWGFLQAQHRGRLNYAYTSVAKKQIFGGGRGCSQGYTRIAHTEDKEMAKVVTDTCSNRQDTNTAHVLLCEDEVF